jgi:hypothetical protein
VSERFVAPSIGGNTCTVQELCDNGVTLAGEVHYHVNRGHRDRGSAPALPGVYKLGGFYLTGLVWEGLFAARPRERTGFAASIGWYGDALNDGRAADGLPRQSHEAVLEVNHRFALGRGIQLQPDLQYIIRPGGTGDIDDALAIGARVSVDFYRGADAHRARHCLAEG